MSKRIKFELEEASFNIVIHVISQARAKLYDDLRSTPGKILDAVTDMYIQYNSIFNDMMRQARCEIMHMMPRDELGSHFCSEICPCNPRVDGNLVVHKAKDEGK
jgi:hypothetical protein